MRRAARGLASRSVGTVRAVVRHVGQVGSRGVEGCKTRVSVLRSRHQAARGMLVCEITVAVIGAEGSALKSRPSPSHSRTLSGGSARGHAGHGLDPGQRRWRKSTPHRCPRSRKGWGGRGRGASAGCACSRDSGHAAASAGAAAACLASTVATAAVTTARAILVATWGSPVPAGRAAAAPAAAGTVAGSADAAPSADSCLAVATTGAASTAPCAVAAA